MNNVLLPPGFYDLTGASAKKHFFILKYCIEYFANRDYNLIIPSLFEYDVSNEDQNSIKVVDPVNNQVMNIRNDITSQISRIWKQGDSKEISKFCYYGDVIYRNKSDNSSNFSRKLTQAGIEYIADSSLERDLEILKIVLEIMEGLKISEFSVLLSFPNLFGSYCTLLNLNDEECEELRGFLLNKNITAIKDSKYSDLVDFIIPGSFDSDDVKIKGLEKEISAVQELIDSYKTAFSNIDIIIDPFYVRNYSYHTDFVFSIVSHKLKRTIARGGSYNIIENQSAVGSSFYIEELSRCI